MNLRTLTTARVLALAEIILALAAAQLAYRSFHAFTALGRWERAHQLNFAPGWTLAAFAFAMIALNRRDPAAYGLDPRKWPGEFDRTVGAAAARTHLPKTVWWAGLALYFFVAVFFGLKQQSPGSLGLLIAWQFCATALGEEIFFRAYAQSRLNEVFARRFRLFGVSFGPGLLLSALLFGVLHAFNTVDYFSGRFTFAWALAFSTALLGLVLGFIREAADSIVPGIVLHGLNNLFWLTALAAQTKILLGH